MDAVLKLDTSIQLYLKSRNDKLTTQATSDLSTVTKVIRSEVISPQDLHQLNLILKDRLLPLFECCADLTIQFTAKLLEYTVSIDKKTTADVRTLVARHFFGVVCENFFCDSIASQQVLERSKATTLTAVFQMLSDSVISHPENQSKLRHPTNLGGRRIGLTLVKLRDFLPMEALLELFANLLPSAKVAGGLEKRLQFIRQVFNSVDFPNHGEIEKILSSPAHDWNATSQRISDLLARGNPLFPQPFETKEIVIGSSQAYPVERIYVDGSGFLSSIDEGASLSTLQFPYRQIEHLSISKSSKGFVTVTIVSKVPPLKNQSVLPPPRSQEGHHRCSWTLKAGDSERMVSVLRHRNLDHMLGGQLRKISLSGPGVEFSDIHPPVPSQVKAKEISSRPYIEFLPEYVTDIRLSMVEGQPKRDVAVITQSALKGTSSTIALRGEKNLSKSPENLATPVALVDGPLPDLTESEPEPEKSPSQAMRRVTCNNKHALVIRSDSEPESPVKQPSRTAVNVSEEINQRPPNRISAQTLARKKGKENTKVQTPRKTRATTRALAAVVDNSPQISSNQPRKRKLEEDESLRDLETEVRKGNKKRSGSVKRPRLVENTENDPRELSTKERSNRPKPRPVRSSRARRDSSSPVKMQTKQHNDDTSHLQVTVKTAAIRMKGKDGKKVGTVKPRMAKPPPVKEERAPKLRDIIPISSDDEEKNGKRSLRRSPRIYKAIVQPIQPSPKARIEEEQRPQDKKSLKPKKAPWERPSIITQGGLLKGEMERSSAQLSKYAEPSVSEVDVHMWGSPRQVHAISSPVVKRQEDTEMIDLTQGSPPSKVGQAKPTVLMPQLVAPVPPAQEGQKAGVTRAASSPQNSPPVPAKQARPTPLKEVEAVQSKTMVDVGIQADIIKDDPVAPQPIVPRGFPNALSTPNPSVRPPVRRPSTTALRLGPSVTSMQEAIPQSITSKTGSPIHLTPTPAPRARPDRSPLIIKKPPTVPRMRQQPQVTTLSPENTRSSKRRAPERITESISDVLVKINHVLLSKIESQLKGVRDDVKIAEKKLLDSTAEKLSELQAQNIEQYNILVDLFQKYATDCRGNLQLFDEMQRANWEVVDGVAGILSKLSRYSLSKKFPKNLFGGVPDVLKERKSLGG
ncbi:hypothetical protein NP233_g1860 [Leucocoprinus birnbaumii]|uniref:Uncharacterized protein n=1 Tax=Leucocoprinus birnbaumii TaxID=56174 RepID=A0AAD5W381_9AGAR|nr:hypothetical protein NP233_g1860 [Leucocoprinus birnbaumii]